ncbi:MAG: type II secretion system minor pseudopilin GspI [Gammaproteobacteria bacterium]|nr:type II secretion system minor pseudopilin GspI [Gammaproteobacteria bacterium]
MSSERLRRSGFTLIEVLVALVIVALGLLAAFGQVNQTLTTASRLRDKTFADWVALNQLTAQRLLGEFPAVGSSSGETEMGRAKWRYTVKVENTDFEDLRQIVVSVAFADNPDQVVTSISGFLGRATGKSVVPGNQRADWAPMEPDR